MEQVTLDLSQFTGTANWFRYRLLPGFLYTDGVQYVAETAGAYWLIDAIFSHQIDAKARKEEFQVWTLKRAPEGTSATLTMTDGGKSGRKPKPIIVQEIEYTDFPEPEITMWLEGKVLLLPSEH